MTESITTGKIGWIDMSAEDATGLRDFYQAVVGWQSDDVAMGGYSDYVMKSSDGEAVAGVCHALESNADLPGGWLIYITVADIETSAKACRDNGGKVVIGPRDLAGGRFCVIEDPGGSVAALYQP